MASIALQLGLQSARHHAVPALGAVSAATNGHHRPYSSQSSSLDATRLASMKRGTGGRSSFNGIVATVLGASGFVGRYVCNRLGKIGSQVIIPYRGDHYDVLRLRLVGDLGQVLFMPYDLRDENSLRKAMKYSNVVINLTGRDWETMNFTFDAVHNVGAGRIARIAKECGVEKLIHVSSLNVSEHPEPLILPNGSKFLVSKWHGENAVRQEFPDAIILRPADIYGSEDRFLRYYAHVWRRQMRYMPLWHKGERTIKQPVYVSDVAAAIVNAIKDPEAVGKTFQAVGPRRYLLSELVDWFHRVMRKDAKWGYVRYDMRWDPTFMLKVRLTEKICPGWPVGPLAAEKIEKDHVTDVVLPEIPTLEDLGVNLTKMESQVPWELRPWRAGAYYDEELGEFEKPAPPNFIV